MYNHNDILIVGDSFAQDRSHTTDWPMALTKMLTGSDQNPNGVGIGGTSWWTVRKYLVQNLDKLVPKILIICHTEAGRLPSDKDIGLTPSMVLEQKYNPNSWRWTKEEFDASAMYYTHLMSDDFHNWSRTQWFNELDKLTASVPIVIHLHCFEQYEPKKIGKTIESFTFKQGITSVEVLFNLQKIGMGTKPIKWQIESLGFRNHFSPENNVKIARALYRTITNFDPAKNGTKQHLDLLDQDEK